MSYALRSSYPASGHYAAPGMGIDKACAVEVSVEIMRSAESASCVDLSQPSMAAAAPSATACVCMPVPAHAACFPACCRDKYELIVVSPRNYFLYTPLLPAVATGTMEERSIVEPVRNLLLGKVS